MMCDFGALRFSAALKVLTVSCGDGSAIYAASVLGEITELVELNAKVKSLKIDGT